MEETMKRSVIIALVLALFCVTAYAQMGQMEQGQMQGDQQMKTEGQMMDMKQGDQPMKMECPKMKMECPKMKMMQGHDMKHGDKPMQMMHCQETIQMLMSVMDMQEKILMGVKPDEKEKMLQDIKQMKEKMKDMMSSCKCMMGGMMEKQAPAPAPAPESTEKKEPAMTAPHHMNMPEPNKE
jgi:hypothetical protein